jgi:hypothetical protein
MIEEKRRVSFDDMPEEVLARKVVGCAECHTMSPDKHEDTFDHNGHRVHVVVTPEDCAVCHPVEVKQFGQNLMSYAYANLMENALYGSLIKEAIGTLHVKERRMTLEAPSEQTEADACLYCHGTVVKVTGMETRQRGDQEMSFPVLSGWPNQGVGRINPDGSRGSCTACHTRHQFSIKMARKPYTCSECHKGPDVPAYKVYSVSKHGNIFQALGGGKDWDFDAVPWVLGEDFTAPTCAGCHVSLVMSDEGDVISERTHQMNDRLSWRIFGLVYAHAHPVSPDQSKVENQAGLPLPTELTGEPVEGLLIDKETQRQRRERMTRVCSSCHSLGWVKRHFDRFENTVQVTNEMTLAATRLLLSAWDQGIAKGLHQGESVFDEPIEKMWVEQWLFFANSTRFASAMMGGDYGVFANGRWYLSKNLREMSDWFEFKENRSSTESAP